MVGVSGYLVGGSSCLLGTEFLFCKMKKFW